MLSWDFAFALLNNVMAAALILAAGWLWRQFGPWRAAFAASQIARNAAFQAEIGALADNPALAVAWFSRQLASTVFSMVAAGVSAGIFLFATYNYGAASVYGQTMWDHFLFAFSVIGTAATVLGALLNSGRLSKAYTVLKSINSPATPADPPN